MSVNKCILLGFVGKDPEIRAMSNGNEVASFSLATTDTWKDKDGNKKDKTEWHNIVVYSSGLAGIVKNYIHKGSKLYVEGALQTRKWTDNSGVEKYTTEIVLQGFGCKLEILDSKKESANNAHSEAKANAYQPQTQVVTPELEEELDDDVPF